VEHHKEHCTTRGSARQEQRTTSSPATGCGNRRAEADHQTSQDEQSAETRAAPVPPNPAFLRGRQSSRSAPGNA